MLDCNKYKPGPFAGLCVCITQIGDYCCWKFIILFIFITFKNNFVLKKKKQMLMTDSHVRKSSNRTVELSVES